MPDRSRPGSPTTARPIGTSQDGRDKSATGVPPNPIRLQTQATTIGTWNVRTLHACGKLQELTHELKRYRWDILGLSEVRWTGFGETTTEMRVLTRLCSETVSRQATCSESRSAMDHE